jgi:hypothetical protein
VPAAGGQIVARATPCLVEERAQALLRSVRPVEEGLARYEPLGLGRTESRKRAAWLGFDDDGIGTGAGEDTTAEKEAEATQR